MTSQDSPRIVPTGSALGAEVLGLDLALPLSADVVRELRQAMLAHGVIYFRGQDISDEDQVRFTGYFGKPVEHVRKQPERPVKEIFFISNVEENGQPIGALSNEVVSFHSDLSYLELPGTISTIYAIELPRTGGATTWCDCGAAYEALDEVAKTRLTSLRAIHRHSVEEQNPPEPVSHPVVCTHPETGHKSLYVGPHLTKSIVGLDEAASRQLLELVFDHLAQPRFSWTHDWQLGDVVMWDNRSTMHRRESFPSSERRIMKRTQILAEQPPRA